MSATTVRIQHNSMQFSDDPQHHAHDAKAIFDFAVKSEVWAITGTESGASKRNHDLRDLLIDQAHEHNFFGYFHRYGEWVALNRRFMYRFDHGYEGPYIKGTHGISASQGAHSPRGTTWAQGEAKSANLGLITVGAQHWLTAKSMKASHTDNTPMVNGSASFGRKFGGGRKIVILDGDANERDNVRDIFQGKPFTTVADELKKWPKTHGKDTEHGTDLDFIATYDHDGRVSASKYRVLDDSDLQLFTDHFVLVADIKIQGPKAA